MACSSFVVFWGGHSAWTWQHRAIGEQFYPLQIANLNPVTRFWRLIALRLAPFQHLIVPRSHRSFADPPHYFPHHASLYSCSQTFDQSCRPPRSEVWIHCDLKCSTAATLSDFELFRSNPTRSPQLTGNHYQLSNSLRTVVLAALSIPSSFAFFASIVGRSHHWVCG